MAGGMDYIRDSSGVSSDILRNRALLLCAFLTRDGNQWHIRIGG